MIKHMVRLFSVLFSLLVLMPAGATARIQVFVSIPPQKYMVQRIGGDRVDVHVMVYPGASPHTYEPRPRQMVAIARTDLYFTIGVEFEAAWMKKLAATNPAMKIVRMQDGIRRFPVTGYHDHEENRHHGDEDHGRDDKHPHRPGFDPHIWLSPPLVKQLASNVLQALQKLDSPNAALYNSGYKQFIEDIDHLDRKLKEMFRNRQQTRFLVFHPSWGYFARAYGLEQVAIEVEGKSPKPAQLKRIIELMQAENIRVIFVQPQFSSRSAKLIAHAIKGRVVFVDPLAEDWLANMNQVAEKFRQALQ